MDIEKRFKEINELIDKRIKNENIDINNDIFEEYDKEYLNLKKYYKNNRKNLNFVRYNYFLRKVYQKECDYKRKVDYSFYSILSFLDINTKNLDTFLFRIDQMINFINIDDILSLTYLINRIDIFIEYIKNNNETYNSDQIERFVIICNSYFMNIMKYIDKISIKEKQENDEMNEIREKIKKFFNAFQVLKRDLKTNVTISQLLYKIGKKQSIYIIRFIFFEEKEEYKKNMRDILKSSIEDMVFFSKQSLNIAKKVYKNKETNENKLKLFFSLKEIDVKMANYFKQLYYDKNTNAAWKSINELKQYLINKIMIEDIDISENLMSVIVDECNLLQAFNKISILKNEIYKLSNNSNTGWIKETLNSINKEFEDIEKLFKYNENRSSVTKLENIDDSFMGTLIEYLLHELLADIKDNKKLVKNHLTDSILAQIYDCEQIILNNVIAPNKPDIDIDLKGRTAILIKNARIKREEFNTIEEELYIVSKELKYNNCYYLINFSKNIDNMIHLKSKFKEYVEDYNIEIVLMDVKEFYDRIFNYLKKPKEKYNFSVNQLYKLFGY